MKLAREKYYRIVSLILLTILLGNFSLAQERPENFGVHTNDVFKILSPKQDSTIPNGQVFLCVLIAKNVIVNLSSVKIFLDNRHITNMVKIQNQKITLIYTESLRSGKHTFVIEAKEAGYSWLKPLKWDFYISGTKSYKEDSVENAFKRQVELTGNITLDTRQVTLTGLGKEYRQEPPHTNNALVNVTLRKGNISFPIKIFQTSDEKTYNLRGLQSRNFYSAGMLTKKFELMLGDQNPMFDKLVLTGIRVQGIRGTIKLRRFQFSMLGGYIQRPFEGSLLRFSGAGMPPPNIRPDSNYIIPGFYRRSAIGVRFLFGSRNEGTTTTFSFLKVKDDTLSIKYGSSPKENFIVGMEQVFVTNQNRLKGNIGVAVSILTNDISQGAVTRADFENKLNTELKADPYKFRKIQTINYTTVLPGWSSLAAFMNLQFKRKVNVFTIDYRYNGVGYQSYGNPFIRNDLQSATLSNQLYIWKRKISINARYTLQSNNLSGTAVTTVFQNFGSGNMVFAYSPKSPQLTVNYNIASRISRDTKLKTLGANDLNSTLNSVLLYTFKAFKCQHSINISYTVNQRTDKIFIQNNNEMHIYAAGIREQLLPINTTIDLQYSKSDINDFSGYSPVNESIDARVRYNSKKYKSGIGIGYVRNKMLMTRFGSLPTTRQSYIFTLNMMLLKHIQINFEAGDSPNRSNYDSRLNYDEMYFFLQINYMLGYMLKK